MKHNCIAILVGLLLILFLINSLPSYADELIDSMNDLESAKFKNNESDLVIVLYNGYYTVAFAQETEISDIINSDWILEKTYMVIPEDIEYGISYKVCRDESILTINKRDKWTQFYEYVVTPSIIFGDAIKINAVYCLDGTPSHNGAYIYYSTNNGDYVLYKDFLTSEDTYLFPLEDFYLFTQALQNNITNSNNSVDASGQSFEEIVDIDKYHVKNASEIVKQPSESQFLLVVVSVITVCMCAVVVIVYKNKQTL